MPVESVFCTVCPIFLSFSVLINNRTELMSGFRLNQLVRSGF